MTITHDGKTMTPSEWARFVGTSEKNLFRRLMNGMKPEKALAPIGITMGGRTQRITAWCEEYGCKLPTVLMRLNKGMGLRDALKKPKPPLKTLNVDGVEKTVVEWAKIKGIRQQVIHSRLARGLSPEDAVNRPLVSRKGDWGEEPVLRERALPGQRLSFSL